MERRSIVSISILLASLAVIVWRAAVLPVTPEEAELWDRAVRTPLAVQLTTPGDWSALVYGVLAKRAVGLFRLSEFSIRFPAILGTLLYLCALYRICGRRIWLQAALSIPPIVLNCFHLAGGAGLSMGLTALALAYPRHAGWTLGLAVAACPQIGVVPATAAAGLL